jgi:hypothetical protein
MPFASGRTRWRRAAAGAAAALLMTAALLALPGAAAGAVVFTDDFEDGAADGWQTTGGRWTVSSDGSQVLRQSRSSAAPARAVAGDPAWRGYAVAARVKPTVLLGSAGIGARIDGDAGYLLALRPGNRVELVRTASGGRTVLAQAELAVRPGQWYDLNLRVDGNQLRGTVTGAAGATTLTVTDATLTAGPVALFTDRAAASFDNVVVDAVAPPDTQRPSTPGPPRLLDVTPTTVTIDWAPSTDDVGVARYIVYFGSQFYEDYQVRQVPDAGPVTVSIGSTTGANLHLSVRAVDAAGNQSGMSSRTFFPQPPSFPRTEGDTVPPSAPGTPTVTGVEAGGVRITWAPSTDDTGVVEYHVVHSFNYDEVRVRAKLPGTTTTAVVPSASMPNQVWVIAYDASWNSAYSGTVILTTPTPPPTPTPGG